MYNVEAGSDFGLSLAILSLLKIELIFFYVIWVIFDHFFLMIFSKNRDRKTAEKLEKERSKRLYVFLTLKSLKIFAL